MDDRPQIRLELMSNPLYLSGAREMVAAVSRRLGFSDEACGQIALAVDEALCNVIRHGYNRATDRPIWISLSPEMEPVGGAGGGGDATANPVASHAGPARALRIVIEDEAHQVDPAQIKSRDLEEVRPGGLGVHIIRAVMDEVKYERRQGSGMRLTMVKRRVEFTDGARSTTGDGTGRGAAGDGGGAAGRAGVGTPAWPRAVGKPRRKEGGHG